LTCESLVSRVSNAINELTLAENQTPDLILVQANQQSANLEACLASVTAVLSSSTSKFLVLFSADSTASNLAVPSFHSHSTPRPSFSTMSLLNANTLSMINDNGNNNDIRVQDTSASSSNSSDSDDTGPQFITSSILIGLLTVAFLLIILFVGLCCTMSIQAPLRFATPSQKLSIGKEY